MILDGWIASHLFENMKGSQQGYITHLRRSKDIWDELRRVHCGRGRLVPMLSRFYGYRKPADESIDLMASNLTQLSDGIYDLAPESKPSETVRAIIVIKACQCDEYNMAKNFLLQADTLTPGLALQHLRSVEQNMRKPRKDANVTKGKRGKSGGQRKLYVR